MLFACNPPFPISFIIDVHGLNVIFVAFITKLLFELIFIVLAHRLIHRAVVQLLLNPPIVTVTPFVSRVPEVTVTLLVQLLNVSCKVHTPPAPLNVNDDAVVIPAKVIVFPDEVALNVRAPVYVRISPEYSVILPEILIAVDPAHVTFPLAGAANVISLQSFVVASIVTV